MNGFERIMAALRGEKPDKIPVMLHNFMLAAHEYGITMEEFRNDPEKMAGSFIHSIEKYKLDGIMIDVDTVTLAGALGVPIDFPVNAPARSQGILFNTLLDIKKLPPPHIESYRILQNWLECVRIVKNHFGKEVFVRGNCDQAGFSLAALVRGLEHFLVDLMTEQDKSLIIELLDYCTEASIQFIRLMSQTGADMVSNGDSLSGPDMVSPEIYQEFALPFEQKIIAESHRFGLPYALHICGNTELILDQMISSGADALELDYKTDSNTAFEKMHDKITLIGNIDPSGVLALGTPELVGRKVQELVQIFGKTNRFILNAGCAIPPSTPEENIRAMLNAAGR